MLSGESYSISILRIKEIIQYGHLTEIPRMPNFIRGVINLRGAVVPVIDLNARFGKPCIPVDRHNGIIILELAIEGETYSVGVMVDAVNAVLDIPDSEIESPPVSGAHINTDFIAGMGRINNKFVVILNIQRVLPMEDMAGLATAVAASTAELTPVSSYKVPLCGNA